MRSDITATIAALISSAATIVYKIAVAFCFCHNLTPHLLPLKVRRLFCSYSDQLKKNRVQGFKDGSVSFQTQNLSTALLCEKMYSGIGSDSKGVSPVSVYTLIHVPKSSWAKVSYYYAKLTWEHYVRNFICKCKDWINCMTVLQQDCSNFHSLIQLANLQ